MDGRRTKMSLLAGTKNPEGPTESKYFRKSPPNTNLSGIAAPKENGARRRSPRLVKSPRPTEPTEVPPASKVASSPNKRRANKKRDIKAAPSTAVVTPRKPKRAKKVAPAGTKTTNSFAPITPELFSSNKKGHVGNEASNNSGMPPPHTLILGTHPSVQSLERGQNYAHPVNAFWWIAGDCLGFRRDTGISASTGKPYQFAQHLRHGPDKILTYEDQQKALLRNGFFLWDVVKSCKRPGSLDSDITDEVANDIPGLCHRYPTIKRVVFANGGSTCALFLKHFRKPWLEPHTARGQVVFQAGSDSYSQNHLGKPCKALEKMKPPQAQASSSSSSQTRVITLISAISVSPAAATYSYLEKREFWERNVYAAGLQDLHRPLSNP